MKSLSMALIVSTLLMPFAVGIPVESSDFNISARDNPLGYMCRPSTKLIGDGDPHQNYLHQQQSVSTSFIAITPQLSAAKLPIGQG